MKKLIPLVVILLNASGLFAAPGRMLITCHTTGRVVLVAPDGEIQRSYFGLPMAQDAWLTEQGTIIASHRNGVKEFAADGSVVWEYCSDPAAEVHSAQLLKNGNMLLCENGTKRLIEVERPSGRILKEIPLTTDNPKKHTQFRMARQASDGSYWVAHLMSGRFEHLNEQGQRVDQYLGTNAHAVWPLENGGLLTSTGYAGGIIEFDQKGNRIWEVSKADLIAAGMQKPAYAAGIWRRPNGNTLLASYRGNPQIIELNSRKEIVWSYHNPELGNIANICVIP